MVTASQLKLARHRAALHRDMLPAPGQANDPDSFTQADLDALMEATQEMDPVPIDEIRIAMAVKLTVYYRRYVAAITGRKPFMPDKTDELVRHLTRGWEGYRISRRPWGVRGVAPLQDWVEGLLGKDGVKPQEP